MGKILLILGNLLHTRFCRAWEESGTRVPEKLVSNHVNNRGMATQIEVERSSRSQPGAPPKLLSVLRQVPPDRGGRRNHDARPFLKRCTTKSPIVCLVCPTCFGQFDDGQMKVAKQFDEAFHASVSLQQLLAFAHEFVTRSSDSSERFVARVPDSLPGRRPYTGVMPTCRPGCAWSASCKRLTGDRKPSFGAATDPRKDKAGRAFRSELLSPGVLEFSICL